MQIVNNSVLVLRTRNPAKYGIIPKSRDMGHVGDGVHEVAVSWGLDEARVLKNLGVKDVPSPILRNYAWPGRFKPFEHQRAVAAFLTLHSRAFNFGEPGTGKTLSALWAADYLMSIGRVRRCLIVSPLSIMHSAWMRDLNHSVIHRTAIVAHHSSADRRREMVGGPYEFVITNYDGLGIVADAVVQDGTFDLVIADECTYLKTASTQRWKNFKKVIGPNTMLWMMTGTPAAQSPVDAYGLAKLVNPTGVPQFFGAWKDKVMIRATIYKWVPKADAQEKVFNALQPAIRHTKAECLDLPPVLTETREVPLTAQQIKYYRLIKEKMVFDTAGETITAVNAAASINKLLQISAGAAYTDNHEVVEFDCSPRLKVLQEVIDETSRKVIVFAPFRHSIDTVQAFLTKQGISHDTIHGGVSVSNRSSIIDAFQTRADPRVLVIQPQAASHGITLTAADTVVYWGPVASLETYLQGIARADRVGQTSSKVTVIHLEGSPVERRMYEVLTKRLEGHSTLVDMYKDVLADDV